MSIDIIARALAAATASSPAQNNEFKELIFLSSTENSTKKFKVAINDYGDFVINEIKQEPDEPDTPDIPDEPDDQGRIFIVKDVWLDEVWIDFENQIVHHGIEFTIPESHIGFTYYAIADGMISEGVTINEENVFAGFTFSHPTEYFPTISYSIDIGAFGKNYFVNHSANSVNLSIYYVKEEEEEEKVIYIVKDKTMDEVFVDPDYNVFNGIEHTVTFNPNKLTTYYAIIDGELSSGVVIDENNAWGFNFYINGEYTSIRYSRDYSATGKDCFVNESVDSKVVTIYYIEGPIPEPMSL